MNSGVISTRYARAIYEYAEKNKCEAAIYKEMELLAKHYRDFPKLQQVSTDPTISIEKKIQILITACGIEINPVLEKTIQMVVENGRAEYMEGIALMYQEIYRKAKGIVIVNLTTAEPISEEIQHNLLEIIPKEENEKIFEFNKTIDSSIIGGFILEIKDRQMDAGVKKQLNQLKLDLTE